MPPQLLAGMFAGWSSLPSSPLLFDFQGPAQIVRREPSPVGRCPEVELFRACERSDRHWVETRILDQANGDLHRLVVVRGERDPYAVPAAVGLAAELPVAHAVEGAH